MEAFETARRRIKRGLPFLYDQSRPNLIRTSSVTLKEAAEPLQGILLSRTNDYLSLRRYITSLREFKKVCQILDGGHDPFASDALSYTWGDKPEDSALQIFALAAHKSEAAWDIGHSDDSQGFV